MPAAEVLLIFKGYSSSSSSSSGSMLVSLKKKCFLFTLLLLLVCISNLSSSTEAARLPKAVSWEQMLPKKLPSPSSAPSKGTNAVSTSSSTAMKADKTLSSSDGKV
ncbi:Glutamate-gated kainate-type ion channel receptor subunit GluR5 [Melia azedarach]|uniref:Glutamate-gated kainate-type ion channel receptor subunit GluR5 n=1 Tax=Melia azedarach TaxID=155640 RepID=A0ACC1WNW4_MELAZ|nr:Glutamate-gated kainate-type ion channel receptor subunit GluR5 [Melia azedarach]